MLGAWLKPSLQWDKQFQNVREKLIISTKKLINTELKVSLTYLYFHYYMIKNVFFGCGVTNFTPLQEKELKQIYKLPIINKLRLGTKFPQYALYIYIKKHWV